MKKVYETPTVEVVKFQYRDQVVAASACIDRWVDTGDTSCSNGNQHYDKLN